jgi:hypothetical protein
MKRKIVNRLSIVSVADPKVMVLRSGETTLYPRTFYWISQDSMGKPEAVVWAQEFQLENVGVLE